MSSYFIAICLNRCSWALIPPGLPSFQAFFFLFVEAPFQFLALRSQAQSKTAQFYTLITKEHIN